MLKPGVKAFVTYNKKLLLILRDNNPAISFPNTWNLPGGAIEEGESNDEAIKRELMEEINVVPAKLFHLGTQIYTDGTKVERYFIPLSEHEYKNIKLGNEGQKLDFFPIEDISNLDLAGYLKEYFNNYKDQVQAMVEDNEIATPAALGLTK